MGASGSAWIKPKKRSGLRSAELTNVPHPRFARPGQRYFPLASRAASRVTLKLIRVAGAHCELKREDEAGRRVQVRTDRLLAVAADGSGRNYRFIGYAPRAGYPTHAFVLEGDTRWTRLVLPEWHPGISVPVATGALPRELRRPGVWLACRADLSADAAARVQPTSFAPVTAAFDPARHHTVTPAAHGETARQTSPAATGEGCGDVVLFLSDAELDDAMAGSEGVYLTGHPPPLRPGARAYLQAGGEVRGWREVRRVRPLPNGTRVVFGGPWQPGTVDAHLRMPASAVAGGHRDQQRWTWRTWPRGA